MGKINKVYYEEVDPKILDLQTAGEFYYLYNLLDTDESFQEEFEQSETNQMYIRNKILGERMRHSNDRINVASSTLAISSLKNKVIVLADIK